MRCNYSQESDLLSIFYSIVDVIFLCCIFDWFFCHHVVVAHSFLLFLYLFSIIPFTPVLVCLCLYASILFIAFCLLSFWRSAHQKFSFNFRLKFCSRYVEQFINGFIVLCCIIKMCKIFFSFFFPNSFRNLSFCCCCFIVAVACSQKAIIKFFCMELLMQLPHTHSRCNWIQFKQNMAYNLMHLVVAHIFSWREKYYIFK